MESRMSKYYQEKPQELSRSKRNQKLYQEVNGSNIDLEYLPVSDNSSEIDVEKLREIVSSREDYQNKKQDDYMEEKKETKKEENKSYDINELLEKARNSKPKEEDKKEENKSYNFLKTLESKELLKSDIEDAKDKEEYKEKIKVEIKQEFEKMKTSTGNTLSLDILSDLKGDTVLVDPVFDTGNDNKDNGKTTDIPINNDVVSDDNEKTFYSGSYKFSSKDFFEDDLNKIEGNHSFIKVFLIILVLAICGVGIYFLINFLGTR